MRKSLFWIAAIFVLALLVALGVSAVAGGPDAIAPPDLPQPDALACDLAVTKGRLGSGEVHPGDYLTYKVDLANYGASTASNVRVTDTLPLAVDYISCARTSGGCVRLVGVGPIGEDLVVWELVDMVPDESETLWITVQVRQQGTWPGWLINRAEVRSSTADSNSANNTVQFWLQVTLPTIPTNTPPPITLPTATPTRDAPERVFLPIVMKQFVPAAPPVLIFSDNFNDGVLTGWTPNKGNWYNAGNYMRGQYASLDIAWNIKNVSGSNFTYEGDVNVISGSSAGLVFRSSPDGTASYEVVIEVLAGEFRMVKRPGGATLASYPWGLSQNHWYHVKVVVNGNTIEGYLDGVKRLTATDTNFTSGQFGVVTYSFAFPHTAAYDNLEAWALP